MWSHPTVWRRLKRQLLQEIKEIGFTMRVIVHLCIYSTDLKTNNWISLLQRFSSFQARLITSVIVISDWVRNRKHASTCICVHMNRHILWRFWECKEESRPRWLFRVSPPSLSGISLMWFRRIAAHNAYRAEPTGLRQTNWHHRVISLIRLMQSYYYLL